MSLLAARLIALGASDGPGLVPVLAATRCADFWIHAARGHTVEHAREVLDAEIERAA